MAAATPVGAASPAASSSSTAPAGGASASTATPAQADIPATQEPVIGYTPGAQAPTQPKPHQTDPNQHVDIGNVCRCFCDRGDEIEDDTKSRTQRRLDAGAQGRRREGERTLAARRKLEQQDNTILIPSTDGCDMCKSTLCMEYFSVCNNAAAISVHCMDRASAGAPLSIYSLLLITVTLMVLPIGVGVC